MTNQQGAPEAPTAAQLIARFEREDGYRLEGAVPREWALEAYNELRRLAALVEAQQPAPSAAAAPDGWESVIHEIRSGLVDSEPSGYDNSGYRSFAGTVLDAVEDGLLKLAASQPSPTPQADSQPAPDEIINMAREQGLPETETEGVFRVNADDLCRVVAAYRAARAQADSVTAPAASEWDVRGHLAGSLSFWHRLKVGEDDELVAAFRKWAPPSCTIELDELRKAFRPHDLTQEWTSEHSRNYPGKAARIINAASAAVLTATATPPAQAADSVLEDADPIRALIAEHAAILDQNESAYFELCYHRATGWMAWITDKPLCMPPVVNPDRKVLAHGQGDTADEACRDAARKQGGAT